MVTVTKSDDKGNLIEHRVHDKTIADVLKELGSEVPSLVRVEDKMAFLSNKIAEHDRRMAALANLIQEDQLKDAVIKQALKQIASIL